MVIWLMGLVLTGSFFYAIYLARLCLKSGLFSIRSYDPSVLYKQKNNTKFLKSFLPISVNTKQKLWSLYQTQTRRTVLQCNVDNQTVYGASIRIKCSSKNLYDMMRSVDSLSIWNSLSLGHSVKENTSTKQIIHIFNKMLSCTNIFTWLFEPLFNYTNIIERTFMELPSHSLIFEYDMHQQDCTIYIIQPVQGREHDQSVLSVVTEGDIYTALNNICYIDDYYILLRTPTQQISEEQDTTSDLLQGTEDEVDNVGVMNGESVPVPPDIGETPKKRVYNKRPDRLTLSPSNNLQSGVSPSDRSVSPEAPLSPVIVDYRTLANKCAADLLAHAHEASTVSQRSKDPDQQPTGWIFNSTDRDVATLFKIREGQNTCCWLGKALIKVHPDQIWTAITNPYTRHIYDELLKEVSVLCDMEDGLKLLRFFYQTSQLLRPDSREFIVLQSERQEKRKRLLCLCSVESPQPEEKHCPRGKFNSSGWIVEPVDSKKSANKPPDDPGNIQVYSMVTYITNIELGGGDTNGRQAFEDELIARQPLAVAELRDYLRDIHQLYVQS